MLRLRFGLARRVVDLECDGELQCSSYLPGVADFTGSENDGPKNNRIRKIHGPENDEPGKL